MRGRTRRKEQLDGRLQLSARVALALTARRLRNSAAVRSVLVEASAKAAVVRFASARKAGTLMMACRAGKLAVIALLFAGACSRLRQPEPVEAAPVASPLSVPKGLIPSGQLAASPATIHADFSGPHVSVSTLDRASSASLSLTAYGCVGAPKPVGRATRAEDGQRVEYRHSGVAEWYQRDARGVEQGFTLTDTHCVSKDVELHVTVSGLAPRLAAPGQGVELLDKSGAVRMHYTDLSARDARGKALRATMSVVDGRIALRVAARGAAYPIVVDPELWSEQGAALVGSDGAAYDSFGS
jgi:hypothetical protein